MVSPVPLCHPVPTILFALPSAREQRGKYTLRQSCSRPKQRTM